MSEHSPKRPPYDPELVPPMNRFYALFPGLSEKTLPALRQIKPKYELADKLIAEGALTLEEHFVSADHHSGRPHKLSLFVYRPVAGDAPRPCIYYLHGGSMVIGDARSNIDMLVRAVVEIGAILVSVNYRLAPENPHPIPVEDCYAGLVWSAENADLLGVDPARIMVAGRSAGGALAVATALLARDRGGPKLSHQLLLGPMLDDRFITASSQPVDEDMVRDRRDYLFGWTALLGDRCGGPNVPASAAPARAIDLSGLPKTYIDVGSAEVFRDEAIDFARRLSLDGVSVDFHMWGGGFHAFDSLAPNTPISQAAQETQLDYIRRAFTASKAG